MWAGQDLLTHRAQFLVATRGRKVDCLARLPQPLSPARQHTDEQLHRQAFAVNDGAVRLQGTGSVSCNSVFVLHLCRFLNQEDLMEREAMVQNP